MTRVPTDPRTQNIVETILLLLKTESFAMGLSWGLELPELFISAPTLTPSDNGTSANVILNPKTPDTCAVRV